MVARLRLITDAASEPVSLADAKLYARVDGSDEDALITALIGAARRHIEKATGLALLTQAWAAVYDRWPSQPTGGFADQWWDGVKEGPISLVTGAAVIEIPKRPFQAVTAIKLRDAYGSQTTVDSSIYFTVQSDMLGRVNKKLGQIWPVVILAQSAAIEIEFTAGFDHANYGGAVPGDLLTCLKMIVKHWYDNRDVMAEGRSVPLPLHINAMIEPWRHLRMK